MQNMGEAAEAAAAAANIIRGLMVDGGEGKKATGKTVHPWDPRPITRQRDWGWMTSSPHHCNFFSFHMSILAVFDEVMDE